MPNVSSVSSRGDRTSFPELHLRFQRFSRWWYRQAVARTESEFPAGTYKPNLVHLTRMGFQVPQRRGSSDS